MSDPISDAVDIAIKDGIKSQTQVDTLTPQVEVFGRTSKSVLPGTSYTFETIAKPFATLIENGTLDDISKAYAIDTLARLGFDRNAAMANFDGVIMDLVGKTGQHVKMDANQFNMRIGKVAEMSFNNQGYAIAAGTALTDGKPVDDELKRLYADTVVPVQNLADTPIPKFFQEGLARYYKFWTGYYTEKMLSPQDKKSVDDFFLGAIKRQSLIGAVLDLPELEKQTEVALGQMAATVSTPEVRNSVVAGAGAGAIFSAATAGAASPLTASVGAIAGYLGSSGVVNAKAEAGNMYLQLASDPEMSRVPDEISRAYSLYYGALSAGIETAPDALIPGISSILRKGVQSALVTGGAKETLKQAIKKNLGKDITKSAFAEALTEAAQTMTQNILTNAAVEAAMQESAFTDAGAGMAPLKLDVWNGVLESMVAGAQGAIGLGLITGGVPAVLARKGKSKNVAQALNEKPVEPMPQSLLGEPQKAIESQETPSGIAFHAITSAQADVNEFGGAFLSTDPEAVVANDKTSRIAPISVNQIVEAVEANLPDFVARDFVETIKNQDHQLSEETLRYQDETGFDFDTLKKDIIPNIGVESSNQDFRDALKEIGIDAKVQTKFGSFVLDPEKTKIVKVQNSPTETMVKSAKEEGFGAIAWKSGDHWNSIVFDPSSVTKISESVTPEVETIQSQINANMATSMAIDQNVLNEGRKAIKSALVATGEINAKDAHVVATVIAALAERSNFSAKTIADKVKFRVVESMRGGVGSYSSHPELVIKLARGQATPEVITHELIHSYLDFAPSSVTDKLGEAYGKLVDKWNKKDHELFVDDAMLYFKEGRVKNDGIKSVFDSIKRFIINTLNRLGKFGVNLRPEVVKFYDDLFNGELLDTDKIQKEEKSSQTFYFDPNEGVNLESVKNAISEGESVNLSVLKNFLEDDQVRQEYNAILESEGILFDLDTMTDEELQSIGYPSGEKERLKNEIGGYGKKADQTFRKFLRTNFDEVISSIRSYASEKLDELLSGRKMDTEEEKASVSRFIGRHAESFRKLYWKSKESSDILYAAAIKAEGQWESNHLPNEQMSEDDLEVDSTMTGTSSIKRLNAMIWSRDIKIEELKRTIASNKARAGAKKALDEKLDKKLAREKREATAALKALKAERVALAKGLERLKKTSPNNVFTDFADMVDFFARIGKDVVTLADEARNVYDLQKLKKLLKEDDILRATIDINVVESAMKKTADKLTLDEVNKLNTYKSALVKDGRDAFDYMRMITHDEPVKAEIARFFEQRRENDKHVDIVDIQNFMDSKYYKSVVTALRDATPYAIDKLLDENISIKQMKEMLREERAKLKESLVQESKEVYPIEKRREGESELSLKDRSAEAQRQRKEWVNRKIDGTIWRRMTRDETQQLLDSNSAALRGSLSRGGELEPAMTKGSLAMRLIAAAQGDLPPDQLLILLDGGRPNGFYYNLIYGRVRGTKTIVGYEGAYKSALHDIQDEHESLMKRYGKKNENYQDRFLLDKETGVITVYDVSKRNEAINLVKDNPSRYEAFTRQAVMEMYTATKSDSKFEGVVYGNNIPEDNLRKYIAAMEDWDKNIADWMLSKYAETVDDLRRAYELSTGKRFVFSDGDYSPIFRDFQTPDYSKEPGSDQAEFRGTAEEIMGDRNAGNFDTDNIGKSRKVISRENQPPIELALVSHFFNHMNVVLRYTHAVKDIDIMKDVLAVGSKGINSPIREQIKVDIGKKNYDYLVNLITELEVDVKIKKDNNQVSRLIRFVTNSLAIAQLALMVANAVLQTTGALLAVPYFRNKWSAVPRIVGKLSKYVADSTGLRTIVDGKPVWWSRKSAGGYMKQAYKQSPFLRDRVIDELFNELERAKLEGFQHGLGKWKHTGMSLFRFVDNITSVATWEARMEDEMMYRRTEAHKKLKSGEITQEQFDEIMRTNSLVSRNSAVEVISRTQPNSDVLSTPANFKTSSDLVKVFLPFMQGISKISSQLVLDLPRAFKATVSKKYAEKYKMKRSALFTTGASIVFYTAIGSFLYFAIKNGKAPEDDDEWSMILNDWLLSPLGLWGRIGLAASDIFDSAAAAFTGEKPKFHSSRFTPMIQSQTDKATQLISEASRAYARGDDPHAMASAVKAAGTVAGFASFPSNFLNHVVDWSELAADGDPNAILMAFSGVNPPKDR